MGTDRILLGVKESEFLKALGDFKKALGEENVYDSPEKILPYSINMLPSGDIVPSAVVRPGSVEEVQKVVRIASNYNLFLYTISTGKNCGLGMSCAVDEGNVIVDLRRMNKILEVNVDLAYAVIEPGVTYEALFNYLRENKMPLWIDSTSGPLTGGIIGNTLEKGAGYTPYFDHFGNSCGMEVVLIDGRVLRTGDGALAGAKTWQTSKWGFGPYLDGLFVQSNYGIVTKMGVWLMPEPPAIEPFFVSFPEYEDIKEAIDLIRPLKLRGVVPTTIIVANDIYTFGTEEQYPWNLTGGETPLPDRVLKRLRSKHKVGAWNISGAVYGTPNHIKLNIEAVRKQFAKSDRAKFVPKEEAEQHRGLSYRVQLMKGEPTLHEMGLYNWRPGGGAIWFFPSVPLMGENVLEQVQMSRRIIARHGFDYICEIVCGIRGARNLHLIPYDRTRDVEREKVKQCFKELINTFAEAGYLVSRPPIGHQEYVMNKLGVFKSVCLDLKKALDPKGILSPGRYGIRI